MATFMEVLIAKYPEKFTGKILEYTEPSPEKQAKTAAIMAELKTLTAPLVKWIRETSDPFTEVTVTWDHVQVDREEIRIPFPYTEE